MSMNLTITAILNDLEISISVPQTPTIITDKILSHNNFHASMEEYRNYIVGEFGTKQGNRSFKNIMQEIDKFIRHGFRIELGMV